MLEISDENNSKASNMNKASQSLCYFDVKPSAQERCKDTFISNGTDSILIPDEHLGESGFG